MRELHESPSVDPHVLGDLFTAVDPGHHLGDRVDEDVFIVDRRQALHGRDYLNPIPVVLVAADLGIWLLRERVEGMFELWYDVLERGIRYITDEQIRLRIALLYERLLSDVRIGHGGLSRG